MYSWQTKRPGKDSHNIKPLNNIQGNNTGNIIHSMVGVIGVAGSRQSMEQARQQEYIMHYVRLLAAIYGDSQEACACLVSKAAEARVEAGRVYQVACMGYSMQEIEGMLANDKAAHLLHVIAEYGMRPGKAGQ